MPDLQLSLMCKHPELMNEDGMLVVTADNVMSFTGLAVAEKEAAQQREIELQQCFDQATQSHSTAVKELRSEIVKADHERRRMKAHLILKSSSAGSPVKMRHVGEQPAHEQPPQSSVNQPASSAQEQGSEKQPAEVKSDTQPAALNRMVFVNPWCQWRADENAS